jgi:beta-lactamase class A
MVEVFQQARAGRLDLDERLALRTPDKTLTSGVLVHLQDGLQPSIRDLLMLMIIVSDNTATNMLLDQVGCENVTASMRALGLHSIHVTMNVHQMFLHAWGLAGQGAVSVETLRERALREPMDTTSRAFSRGPDNNVASAADMANLMRMIFLGQVVDRAACDEMLTILSHQQYQQRVPRYLPWYRAHNKTGTFRGVRNDSGLLTCSAHSHVAYSVFSFDSVELSPDNPRGEAQRALQVDLMLADIGLAVFEHYGGRFEPL